MGVTGAGRSTALTTDSKEFLNRMLQQERSEVVSPALLGQQGVWLLFEVSNAHKNRVPGHYLRKQTRRMGNAISRNSSRSLKRKFLAQKNVVSS